MSKTTRMLGGALALAVLVTGCKGPNATTREDGGAVEGPGGGENSQAEWMARQAPNDGAVQTTERERDAFAGRTDPPAYTEVDDPPPAEPARERAQADPAPARDVLGQAAEDGAGDSATDPESGPESVEPGMVIVDERARDGRPVPAAENPELRSSGTPEQRSLDKALELYTRGELERALLELEQAIAFNPAFIRAYIEMGDILVEMGDDERAERVLREAVRNEPLNYMAQYRHAVVLEGLGRLDEARRAYLRALRVRRTAADANLGLSTVLLQMGESAQALPYAKRAVDNEPTSGRGRMHLGNVLASLGNHAEAVVEYQQAADAPRPPEPGLLLNLSESLNELERYAEMVGALEQLVLVEPSAVAYERLGSGYFRLRRYDEALAAFNESSKLDPDYFPAYNGIAVGELNNYLWSGQRDGSARERAVAAMRTSLRLERDQPRIVQLLGRYALPGPAED